MVLHMVGAYSAYRQACVLAKKTGGSGCFCIAKLLVQVSRSYEKSTNLFGDQV